MISSLLVETPKSNALKSFYLKFTRTAFVDAEVFDDVEMVKGEPTVSV